MAKLQVLPEQKLSLQVLGQITKAGDPVILPIRIAQNGTYYAGADKASGYNPVTVDVDMTPAKEEGYLNGYEAGAKEGAEVGYAKGEQEGYTKGYADGTAKYMWAPYIRSGTQLFRGAVFPANTEMTVEFEEIRCNMQFFVQDAKNIKKLTLICRTPSDSVLDCAYMCHNVDVLEVVDISRFNRKMSLAFAFPMCRNLREIIGVMDMSNTTALGNTFEGCNALEEFRVVPGSIKVNINLAHSPNLSAETIQSVIDGLSDLTGATTRTLSVHKDVGNRLTQSQKDAISAKNWTLAY